MLYCDIFELFVNVRVSCYKELSVNTYKCTPSGLVSQHGHRIPVGVPIIDRFLVL